MIKKLLLLILQFYQKFLSILSLGSCRYHPTCSEYAKWQFENNNILFAFYHSFIRILRCNQLFEGGFDYPEVKHNFTNIVFKKINVKYWYIPTKKNNYIIIKNWEFKNGTK
ncbi:MAG: membrane protein insertion efficiency factor YidD [Arcobacteraceae bacterium]|nr:membrane protein insertion efficiency factor YidD [Arcobacteraceae bacterium]